MKRGLIIYSMTFVLLAIGMYSVSAVTTWERHCTDSDNGIDYFVYGYVTYSTTTIRDGVPEEGEEYTSNDECFTDGSGKIVEKSCTPENRLKSDVYQCPEGCANGACLGEVVCVEDWSCTSWATCVNSQQTRTCTDANNCGTTANKPLEAQTCDVNCNSNWNCLDWGECGLSGESPIGGIQQRLCTDSNECNANNISYSESKNCDPFPCNESWNCTEWGSICWPDDNTKRRMCTDLNQCGTIENRPAETKSCSATGDNNQILENNGSNGCTESWSCNEWSNCMRNRQGRVCIDSNDCGTIKNKPEDSRECSIYIGERKIILDKNEKGENRIESDGKSVITSLEVMTASEKIYLKSSSGDKELMISPDEVVEKIKKIDNVLDIQLVENIDKETIIYSITGTKKVRLFFLFPIEAEIIEKINAETGERISINKPWWHIFAFGI